ncbi:hypothetical protein GCM10029992_25390 [Glycomyces albus]
MPGSAIAQACQAGTESDFDGDGLRDLAIADPDAAVDGHERAGRVHIAYGDGSTMSFSQAEVPGVSAEAGDRFGFAMDTVDWDGDGCTDLVIGSPFEAIGDQDAAGHVAVVFGSPSGLDPAAAEGWTQGSLGVDTSEVGDRFGFDLAAATDTAGDPFVVIGMPGESSSTLAEVGQVVYVRPGAAIDFNQNSPEVPGVVEAGDLYGYAVAASARGFAVGGPGEAIEEANYAGTVHLFGHSDGSEFPPLVRGWNEDSTGFSGLAEEGNMYGFDLSMVDYISTTGGGDRSMLAIGAPGKRVGDADSLDAPDHAGRAMVVWETNGVVRQYVRAHQDADGFEGSAEEGDAFGATVAMVNRTPDASTGEDTLLMVAGVPGEDADGLFDVGQVHLYSMTEDVAVGGDPALAQLEGAGFTPADGAAIGTSILATGELLLIADVRSPDPAVYGVPWDNIVAGGTDPVQVWTPSDLGIDPASLESFGLELA